MQPNRHAIILGVTSDIGLNISERLLAEGWLVTGLGRDPERGSRLSGHPDFAAKFQFVSCDLGSKQSISDAVKRVTSEWSLFVSCAGTMRPIGPFFETDFDHWEQSLQVNASAQLRVLHGIWQHRTLEPDVMFLAGGGTNNPFPNYSAYCVSKIALIKMCELIHDENPETNIFIIGPGYMRTRIHEETLDAGQMAGDALSNTEEFLRSGELGTTHDELYQHMKWCMENGRHVAGGRNFSTVHDGWRAGGRQLAENLNGHKDAFRLRRYMAEGNK